MQKASITGWGKYLPDKILTNEELEGMVDTSDEWIKSRTGIKQRYIAAENQTTGDLGPRSRRNNRSRPGGQIRWYERNILVEQQQFLYSRCGGCFKGP